MFNSRLHYVWDQMQKWVHCVTAMGTLCNHRSSHVSHISCRGEMLLLRLNAHTSTMFLTVLPSEYCPVTNHHSFSDPTIPEGYCVISDELKEILMKQCCKSNTREIDLNACLLAPEVFLRWLYMCKDYSCSPRIWQYSQRNHSNRAW